MTQRRYIKVTKLILLGFFVVGNVYCQRASKIIFQNNDLKKEVNLYLKKLKRKEPAIISIVIESYVKRDSVFITLANAVPDITEIKAYTKYQGVDFCFATKYPLSRYYKIVNPTPVPMRLKNAYNDIMEQKRLGTYEPFTENLIFYKGKIVKRDW